MAPFYCVLGQTAFVSTHRPERTTMVLPSDRIEPVLGSQILRSSAIDSFRGVIVSLSGDPIDLAVAVNASPQFLNINDQGQYRFRVVERFALRIKDPEAIARLEFIQPGPPPTTPTRARRRPRGGTDASDLRTPGA